MRYDGRKPPAEPVDDDADWPAPLDGDPGEPDAGRAPVVEPRQRIR